MGTDRESEWDHLDRLHRRGKFHSRVLVGGALGAGLVLAWIAGARATVDDYWLTAACALGAIGLAAIVGRAAIRMGAYERDFERAREKNSPPNDHPG